MKILVTADWHLRGEAPPCRVRPDQWLDDQAQSVMDIQRVASKEKCDEVWILGDLFHHARVSTEALVIALILLKGFRCPVRILPGNHDLVYHSYANLGRSSIGAVLTAYPELRSHGDVAAYAFGTEPPSIEGAKIWCTHQLTFPDEKARPIPGIGVLAEELLEKSDAKLILTGDYHHAFVKEFGDRRVAACGCINIQASDMGDYEPQVFILDTDTLGLEAVKLQKFGQTCKDATREAGKEVDTYVESLQAFEVPKLDFIANVVAALAHESKGVRDCVEDVLDLYKDIKETQGVL